VVKGEWIVLCWTCSIEQTKKISFEPQALHLVMQVKPSHIHHQSHKSRSAIKLCSLVFSIYLHITLFGLGIV